jgi:alpha-galactosidase/6-phospho-beta-glucosidase family protein
MRITVVSDLDKNDAIKRIAFIKKPIFNAKREKYIWTTVENYTIPYLEEDKEYLAKKKENFDLKLDEWDKRLKANSNDNYIPTKIEHGQLVSITRQSIYISKTDFITATITNNGALDNISDNSN